MAKLEIAEFDMVHAWGLLGVPSNVQTGIEIAGASAQSAAFSKPNIETGQSEPICVVEIKPRADCRIEFGVDPTATPASDFFFANVPITRLLTYGHKLAVIAA